MKMGKVEWDQEGEKFIFFSAPARIYEAAVEFQMEEVDGTRLDEVLMEAGLECPLLEEYLNWQAKVDATIVPRVLEDGVVVLERLQ